MTTQEQRQREQLAVLSNAEMYEADRLATAGGIRMRWAVAGGTAIALAGVSLYCLMGLIVPSQVLPDGGGP